MTIAKTKKGSLKFSIKHRPPLTASMVLAAFAMMQVSKGVFIDSLPLHNKELIKHIGEYYTYIINAGLSIFSLACVFLGIDTTSKSPYAGVADNIDPTKLSQN